MNHGIDPAQVLENITVEPFEVPDIGLRNRIRIEQHLCVFDHTVGYKVDPFAHRISYRLVKHVFIGIDGPGLYSIDRCGRTAERFLITPHGRVAALQDVPYLFVEDGGHGRMRRRFRYLAGHPLMRDDDKPRHDPHEEFFGKLLLFE